MNEIEVRIPYDISRSQLCKREEGNNIIKMTYFLAVKTFNESLDVSTLLPVLDSSWEVAVHSYYIATENDQTLGVNCNLEQYDRNLQKPHLLEVITNSNGSVHVLCWKKYSLQTWLVFVYQ